MPELYTALHSTPERAFIYTQEIYADQFATQYAYCTKITVSMGRLTIPAHKRGETIRLSGSTPIILLESCSVAFMRTNFCCQCRTSPTSEYSSAATTGASSRSKVKATMVPSKLHYPHLPELNSPAVLIPVNKESRDRNNQ